MPDRANRHPSGRASSATGHRFGTRRLRELLAARGDAGLWLADDDDGGRRLLRVYPGLPTLEEWHALELAASQLLGAIDPHLVPVEEVVLDVWPCLTFACAEAEPLTRRIAREPLAAEAAVMLCADVGAALAALERVGVPPVDISPADVVFVGGRARLLADVGLPGGRLAHACVDLDHVAPERAVALAARARGVRGERPGASIPTPESMTWAMASIVTAALQGPRQTASDAAGASGTTLASRLEPVLRRGMAPDPSERQASPAVLAAALAEAIGVNPWRTGASGRRTTRGRGARSADPGRARAVGAGPAPVGSGRRPGRRAMRVVLPAAVVLAAGLGIAAGSATTASDPPATVTLADADLSVEAPRGWLTAGPGAVPSAIGDPALVARPPGATNGAALAVTREAGPLLARLAGATPEPVRLGDHDAWRYRDVAVGAGDLADVFVLRDAEGAVVAICLGSSPAVRARCSAALTTLRLAAGPAEALGGDAASRRELARAVDDLDRARAEQRRALAAARTGRGQAVAADRLAAAYARAAEAAGRAGPVGAPGDLPRLVDRLERTGRAYAALAAAARETRRAAWAQARERVGREERAVAQGLAALGTARASA